MPDTTGDVIITIKSDAEDAFQFKVTGYKSKKDGQVVEQQIAKKRNNTDKRQNNKPANRVNNPAHTHRNTNGNIKHSFQHFSDFKQTKSYVRIPLPIKFDKKRKRNHLRKYGRNSKMRPSYRKKRGNNYKRRRPSKLHRPKRKYKPFKNRTCGKYTSVAKCDITPLTNIASFLLRRHFIPG